MAAPNIVNVSTITGKSLAVSLDTTSLVGILTNSASSNEVFKINTIRASNVGVVTANVSIGYGVVAGTTHYLASTIEVPVDSSLLVVDKTNSFYLEENQQILAKAETSGDLDIFVSYEEIS